MDRISEKDLKRVIDDLNTITGNPLTYGTRTSDEFKANIGNYHLYCAYGGYELVQTMNEGGGVHVISRNGCTTKRDLYTQIKSLIDGVALGRNTH